MAKIDAPVGWVAAGGPLTLQPASGIRLPFLGLVFLARSFGGHSHNQLHKFNQLKLVTCNFKHKRFA